MNKNEFIKECEKLGIKITEEANSSIIFDE